MVVPCMFFLLINACTRQPLFDLPEKNKLVILAEIFANDSITIPIASTMIAGNNLPVHFDKINDAIVTLTDQIGNQEQLQLKTASGMNDPGAAFYCHPEVLQANADYTIEVTHPVLGTAIASTHIPSSFSVTNVRTEEGSWRGKEVLDFSFRITDNANEDNYYIFEAIKQGARLSRFFYWQGIRYDYDSQSGKDLYEMIEDEQDIELPIIRDTLYSDGFTRLTVYTQDHHTDNNKIGSLDSSFNRIFITDSTFNGGFYTGIFSINTDQFLATTPEKEGIVLVRIKSVDRIFYHYMLQYEKYKTDFGKMPAGLLPSPSGNIQNGLGVFGGSFKHEWRFFYDDLE